MRRYGMRYPPQVDSQGRHLRGQFGGNGKKPSRERLRNVATTVPPAPLSDAAAALKAAGFGGR